MKNTILLATLFSALLLAAQTKPLIAPVSEEDWKPARNVQAKSTFELTEQNGEKVMKVSQDSDEGYTFYRTFTTLAPGDYTFIVQTEGKSEKGLLQNAYSFDKDGKPSLLFFHGTDGGVFSPAPIYITFKVPEDSVSQRFDVGISGNRGTATYWAPEIREGKVTAPAVQETGFRAIPAAKGWIAEWIWFEGDKGVPAMDFAKEFELTDEPSVAICEMTVDNGYELVVNGESVGSDVDWHSVETYDLAAFLHKGRNTIVVHAKNTDGLAGLLFQAVILDASENATVVKTDATWSVTHTDGTPATIKSFGETSATTGPWGNMTFHKITPPRALVIKPIDAIRETKAGGMISFQFPLPPELGGDDRQEFPELQVKYIDVKTGEAISISGVPFFARCVFDGPKKTLWCEHLTSRYANPGTYRVEISGKDYVIHAGEVTISAIDLPEGSGALMPNPSLKNYLETDFYKQSLYVFAAENASREAHISWSRTGGHFYELMALTGTWSKEMLYDMTVIEQQMQDILEQDPLATVNLKFRIDVPGWWCAAHPEDVYLSKQGRSAQQSFCSEQWRKDAIQTIINSMEWLQNRPVGRALAGVLIMGFRGGEFQLWGEDVGERDCSPVARRAFDEYQTANSIEPRVSLDDPALDYPWTIDGKESTAHARDVFFRFVAERQSENMIYFSNEFKKHFGDRYTFAFYFGYGMEYGGSNMRMLLAGHLGIENVYDRGTIDMESCPLSYGLRPMNRSHGFMYPVESARLHNILPIGENDIRNCLEPGYNDGSGVTLASMNTSIVDNRRIRYFCAAHGALVRYLALHPIINWYDHPAFWRTIREDNEMTMELTANEIGGEDQIAMAVNFMEFTRAWRIPEEQVGKFAGYARDRLMRTGHGVDFITMRDFINQPIVWKMAYIPLPGLLTDEQRSAIAAKYGKPLPKIREDDGALVWRDGKWSILSATATDQDIWKAFATPEALEAGFDTIWYKGGNFLHTWDGKTLK